MAKAKNNNSSGDDSNNNEVLKTQAKFATCLNCIDGRTHQPIINWITGEYAIDYVDLITEPGMVGKIGIEKLPLNAEIFNKVSISIEKHSTQYIFIAAHHDCVGNPVDEREQITQVICAVKKIQAIYPSHNVTGLWVDDKGRVREV